MSCEEIENEILDYQENHLSPVHRREVELHLLGCAGCRAFAHQLQQLDAAFSARIRVPVLSADFSRRLRARIQAFPTAMSEVQRAQRKRQLQDEFEAGVARIHRRAFASGNMLNHLVWPVLALVAGWVAWFFTSQVTDQLHAQSLGGLPPDLVPWLAASAVFLVVVMAEAFPRRWNFFGL